MGSLSIQTYHVIYPPQCFGALGIIHHLPEASSWVEILRISAVETGRLYPKSAYAEISTVLRRHVTDKKR